MNEGWIKLHRSIFENELYFAEKFSRMQAFLDIVLLASYKPTKKILRGTIKNLERGQLMVTVRTLSERWQWSCSKVIDYLRKLENMQMISIERNKATNVITILNYEKYQDAELNPDFATKAKTGTPKSPINTKEIEQNQGVTGTQTGTQIGTPNFEEKVDFKNSKPTGTPKSPINTTVLGQNQGETGTQTGTPKSPINTKEIEQNQGDTGTHNLNEKYTNNRKTAKNEKTGTPKSPINTTFSEGFLFDTGTQTETPKSELNPDFATKAKTGTPKSPINTKEIEQNRVVTGTQTGTQIGTPTPIYYIEENNNIFPPLGGYDTFDFSFVEESFREVFYEWLQYKRERKEKYKSQRSLKLCYDKLKRLSNGDAATARLIVEESMSNNYAGLFELKDRRPSGNGQYMTRQMAQAMAINQCKTNEDYKKPNESYPKGERLIDIMEREKNATKQNSEI